MRGVRPVVLAVLDGWGVSEQEFGNAIAAARTPVLDAMMERWPWTVVAASGEAVGLPDNQQGNSEVGHLTIGSGRVVHQPLTRISRAIRDGSFFDNPELTGAVDAARERGASLHCLGLVSEGGVHSDQRHAVALARLARDRGLERVFVHAFTDGRDEPPRSAAGYLERFVTDIEGSARMVSITGRYFAMDRDTRWERTQRAYEMLVAGVGERTPAAVDWVKQQYAMGVTDEFLPPCAVVLAGEPVVTIGDGDSVVMFNFRPDRVRQLSHALLDESFSGFPRSRVPRDLHVVTFTEYERDLPVRVAFPRQDIRHCLAEEVSAAGLRQFHVAETEKYAHVTYFINGGIEAPFPGEERLLVPSPRVATYDLTPAMNADGITDAVVDHLRERGEALVVLNFANPDMVGHTGDFRATVEACEHVDRCLGRIERAVDDAGGTLLITADHGNAEHKVDPRDGSPITAHTCSPVPVVLCGVGAGALRPNGGLEDVAPTILELMGLPVPAEMSGRSLLMRRAQPLPSQSA